MRSKNPKKQILGKGFWGLPLRLWKSLCTYAGIKEDQRWAELSNKQAEKLAIELSRCTLKVNGKSTFKEEFVTAGGVNLKEVNFKSMESKLLPGLYFAGELLDIDAVTGGFNFQAAWTTAWLAAQDVAERL